MTRRLMGAARVTARGRWRCWQDGCPIRGVWQYVTTDEAPAVLQHRHYVTEHYDTPSFPVRLDATNCDGPR